MSGSKPSSKPIETAARRVPCRRSGRKDFFDTLRTAGLIPPFHSISNTDVPSTIVVALQCEPNTLNICGAFYICRSEAIGQFMHAAVNGI